MRRTRKLCAVMVDVVGREIVLNRPSKVLRRPAASQLPAHLRRAAAGVLQAAGGLSLLSAYLSMHVKSCCQTRLRARRSRRMAGRALRTPSP